MTNTSKPHNELTLSKNQAASRTIQPLAAIYENDQYLTVELEMPGSTKDKISISVTNDELSISAERALKPADGQLVHRESPDADYFRTFILSDKVDCDKIQAKYDDGILTLTLPKAETAVRKNIPVT